MIVNQYLVALIGVLVLIGTGWVFFGLLFKDALKDHAVPLTASRFVQAGITTYLLTLAMTVLFNDVEFASGVTGAMKGLYLGLLVGIPFFAIPLFNDSPYFRTKDSVVWIVLANWVVALALLGLVIGWLI